MLLGINILHEKLRVLEVMMQAKGLNAIFEDPSKRESPLVRNPSFQKQHLLVRATLARKRKEMIFFIIGVRCYINKHCFRVHLEVAEIF